METGNMSLVSAESMAMPNDKETFGAQVVSKTLDTLNQNDQTNRTNSDYQFQQSVLEPYYTGRGTILDALV